MFEDKFNFDVWIQSFQEITKYWIDLKYRIFKIMKKLINKIRKIVRLYCKYNIKNLILTN